jgi:hypothetical protein
VNNDEGSKLPLLVEADSKSRHLKWQHQRNTLDNIVVRRLFTCSR